MMANRKIDPVTETTTARAIVIGAMLCADCVTGLLLGETAAWIG